MKKTRIHSLDQKQNYGIHDIAIQFRMKTAIKIHLPLKNNQIIVRCTSNPTPEVNTLFFTRISRLKFAEF